MLTVSNMFIGEEYNAGRVAVTVGGDQLTRCHLDSAKQLRAGTHEPCERFDHLTPVVEEMFHVQQDYLEVRKSVICRSSSKCLCLCRQVRCIRNVRA